jgi:hypothetical protein
MGTNVRKKGTKSILVDLNVGEEHMFERKQYSLLRTTMSIARIEYPGRNWDLDLTEDGIKITCVS